MDTINANLTPYSKFITLTTKDTVLDRSQFLKLFDLFRRAYKTKYGKNLPYLGKIERQKKRGLKEGNEGSWHIHLCCFFETTIQYQAFQDLWTFGFTNIEKVRSGDVGRYFMKYLTKDDLDIKKNKKVLFKSTGLKEPSTFETMTQLIPGEYDYITSWDFYQGDLKNDFPLDPNKMNHCTLYEVHHSKEKKG